ncbi:MAG: polysaccharide biosynthesis protein, partial [Eubacteriaceae bacterium]|nr:polysaccharide biosynthesis protein [Eubacteriaceae bacterium]
RFFMTVSEAVSLVLTAGSISKGGEIFVLNMGKPVKIRELAENFIRLNGKEPYTEIPIKFIGLRPGEKLYEELLIDNDQLKKTDNEKIFVEPQEYVDEKDLYEQVDRLNKAARVPDPAAVADILKEIVPEFDHRLNEK